MSHPSSRSERRFVRQVHIQKRVYILKYIWEAPQMLAKPGRYSKWHLSCGNLMCHADKFFSARRRRRAALTHDIVQNIKDWQE